jgi:hypothetical protein
MHSWRVQERRHCVVQCVRRGHLLVYIQSAKLHTLRARILLSQYRHDGRDCVSGRKLLRNERFGSVYYVCGGNLCGDDNQDSVRYMFAWVLLS